MNKSYLDLFLLSILLSNINGQIPCSSCINFVSTSIDILLNYISQGLNVSSCNELCSSLPNQGDMIFCEQICGYIGLSEFIRFVVEEDPDAVYLCGLIGSCAPTG